MMWPTSWYDCKIEERSMKTKQNTHRLTNVVHVFQICEHLKNYIGARQLYDVEDPKVVYCGNDPLGKVFNVDKFEATIDQVS